MALVYGRISVLSPHPDDEVIGCGGSLAKHSLSGSRISIINIGARLGCSQEADLTPENYREESRSAAAVLGAEETIDLGLTPRNFSVDGELVFRLVEILRRVQPDVVYLPHGGEADLEHRHTHDAGVEALWMAQSVYFEHLGNPMRPPSLVLEYEVWTPMTQFQYVEDISETIDAKVKAMRCYKSQLRHATWDKAVQGLAAYRGTTTLGHGYAEVFAVRHLRNPAGR